MKVLILSLVATLLVGVELQAADWTIDSADDWTQNIKSAQGATVADGSVSPEEKTATVVTKVHASNTKRSAKALTVTQSAIWQNWNPIENLGPVNLATAQQTPPVGDGYLFHDSHFHLTNYVQEGTDIEDFLEIMGDKVGRSVLSGIPLQQQWMYANTGDFAPTYYTQTDAPLYYYSFTDAIIAHAYLRLTPEERRRFDPMITGFNPTDMYAADHIRRVLLTFPGVFSGIGEFSIHKEFVSSKVAGEVATLENKALDRIMDFAAEVGLPVILHCDVNTPFPRPNQDPYIATKLRELARRHRDTTIIWAHVGLGRIVRPVDDQLGMVERGLRDPESKNIHFDISWDETAKYLVGTPEAVEATTKLINQFPNRFLFGTDSVAPRTREEYLKTYDSYAPLLAELPPETSHLLLKGNYERIFDEARRRVREWEAANK